MLEGKRIAVVIPAYNEGKLIEQVLQTLPDIVDEVVVVDDASGDDTAAKVRAFQSNSQRPIHLVEHGRNRGAGAAVMSGYERVLELDVAVAALMAGDAQTDPEDLPALLEPVVRGEVDYTKGNRLFSGDAWKVIPRVRYLGNAVLSLLTKIASGYWHIADSQTGYTAINVEMLRRLKLKKVYAKYGWPNDFLIRLNVLGARVRDVTIKPIYNVGEQSGMFVPLALFTIGFRLKRMFVWRLVQKYVIRDFHPLVFFYFLGFLFNAIGLALGIYETYNKIVTGEVAVGSVVLVALLMISGIQFLCFAMWFDMQDNRDLR